jgi:hypothetical protein
MLTFTQFLSEGRSFSLNGKKYSSGFGRYTCDGKSIEKPEYEAASKAYKEMNGGVVKKTSKEVVKTPIQKNTLPPYREGKSVKDCEKFINEVTGIRANFDGMTDKRYTNIISKSIYKVHSKYPLLCKSGYINFIGTVRAGKKNEVDVYEKHYKSDERCIKFFDDVISSHLNNYPITEGMTLISALNRCGVKSSDKGAEVYYNALGYDKYTVDRFKNLTKDECEKIIDVFKNTYIRKSAEQASKKESVLGKNIDGGTIAFYHWNKVLPAMNGIYTKAENFAYGVKEYNIVEGMFPKGTDAYSIITHEFGHVMDKMLGLKTNEEIVSLWNECSSKKNFIIDNLSAYANMNIQEFISEAFSEYCDSPEPRPIAKAVGSIIDKLYHEYARNNNE